MCDQPVPQKTIDDEVSRCEPTRSSNEQVSIGNGTTADVTCAESRSSDVIVNNNSDADSCVSSISSISERVKDTDRRRSKSGRRRSGFSRGRISLTQLSKDASGAWGAVSGSELYKQIPVDHVPAQRLSLLTRLALRHTLEVLDKEFEDVPGFENFKAEGLVSVGATIDQMESDGTFEQACITSCFSLSPNPLNIQMDTTISELKRSINRLQQEDAAWDELVNQLEAQAQQAEQKLSQLDIAYSALPEDVKELSSSFLPSPSEMPDLAVINSEAVKDVKAISLLMDDYCHSVGLLSCANRAARKHMDCLISTLDQGSSRKMYDPKENIQQVFAS